VKKRSNRAAISAAAMAVSTVLLGGATAASAQDAFVKFHSSSKAIGGFAPDGSDSFYQANFGSDTAGFSKWTLSGSTWSETVLVGATDMQTFGQSSSVAGNGTLPATPSGGASTFGDIVLNPAPLTISRVGVASPITYPAGTIGFVIDQSSTVKSGTTDRHDLTKVGSFYDLRAIGAPDGAGVNRNGSSTVQWNDVFEPLFSRGDMRSVVGYGGTGTSVLARHFTYSSDGQSVYFVDSSQSSITGGLWKKTLTAAGTTGLSRIMTPSASINVEPSVVASSVRNFGGGAGDQVIIQGQATFATNPNGGGVSYVVDDGIAAPSAPKTLLTAKQLQWFRETTGTPNIFATASDDDGNLYFYDNGDQGVFKYDTAGRLVKVFSRAEQIAFDTSPTGGGSTTSSTATVGDMKVRNVTYNGPGGPFTVGQLLYSDTTTAVRAPVGVNLFKPGDFDRDNDVDAADVTLFKSKLGLRGVVAASVLTASPFTQTNGADMKFDLNMSTTPLVTGPAAAVVAIDWKDAKIFQQYAGLSAGDVDMDFDVDLTDLDAVGDNYNNGNNKLFTQGNLSSVRIAAADRDTVNYADLVTLAANWTGPKPTAGDLSGYSAEFIADATRAFGVGTSGLPHRYVAAADGAWSNAANWTNGVPDGVDQQANLLTDPSNDVNLTVDGNFTVGQLNFDHYFNYTVGGGGTITLEVSTGNAQVNAFAASPIVNANLAIHSNVDVNVAYAQDTLRINGAISGTGGSGINKTGPGTLTLAAANTYTGGTTVAAGTLLLANADATGGGAVSVAGGALAQAQASLPKAVTVSTLTTSAGGKFDLTNNSMVVKSMTVAQVQALIQSAFNAGTWTGATGLTSSIAASASPAITAIGFASNGVLNKSEFKGVTGLDADDVLVKHTYYGDSDLNGETTLDDYTLFLNGYQTAGTTWVQGDYDYNGLVTLDDFTLFLAGYQNQGAPLTALEALINSTPMSAAERSAMLAAVQAVPEPTGLALIGAAGAGLLSRRRRRGQ
jgi:autotransporter-associated beta strand protein